MKPFYMHSPNPDHALFSRIWRRAPVGPTYAEILYLGRAVESPVVSQKPTADFLPCVKVPTGY